VRDVPARGQDSMSAASDSILQGTRAVTSTHLATRMRDLKSALGFPSQE